MNQLYLVHHGIQGQKWGVRNGPPYPIDKQDKVFVSGSSKTEFKDQGYYRKRLPKEVKQELTKAMKKGDRILVGDAPGIDHQVQKFLAKKMYERVDIYTVADRPRNYANKGEKLPWNVKKIDASEYPEGSKEWLAKKDKAMQKDATRGLAVILDEGSSATRKNIDKLLEDNKDVYIYQLSGMDKKLDRILSKEEYKK